MPRKPPPTTGELLLRAVFAEPEDDAPRLAYADWLDESGGEPERAALIRVQCELARLPPGDTRHTGLEKEEAKLFRGRKVKWRAQLPKLRGVVWGEFSRGFVDSVVFKSTYPLWRFSTRIAAAIPLRTVTVRPAGPVPREMLGVGKLKALSRVSNLNLSAQQMNDERLAQLLGSPHLGRLASLDLSGNQIGDVGVSRLIAAVLPGLRTLDLNGNRIGLTGARLLAESALPNRLEVLDLLGNRIPLNGQEQLRAAFGDRVRV